MASLLFVAVRQETRRRLSRMDALACERTGTPTGADYTNVYKLKIKFLYTLLSLVGGQTTALMDGWFGLVKEREHLLWLKKF